MKSWMAGMILAALVSPCAFAGNGRAAAKGDAAAGKDVFTKRCAMCHGPDATGDTPMAKALGATIPDFRSKTVQDMTDADLKKQILEGKNKMPPQSGLSDDDIANVIAYIRTFAAKKP
jgi:mono/diheme cytochrome c family protein